MENTLGFAGDVGFNSAVLTSFNGAELEIVDLIQRIDIYEDLYSPFMTIDILVIDSIGVLEKTPMIGEEIITLDVKDAAGQGFDKKRFFIYKIKDRIFTADKTNMYTMCCISLEALIDMNLKISKAYQGQPSDIATSIIADLKGETETKVFVEQSKNTIQFIANYWSPVQILKFLCDRTISKATNSPTYLIYENLSGINFVSQDMLVCQDSTSKFTLSNRLDNDPAQSFMRVQKLYIDEEFDYITRLNAGMYGTRLLQVNPMSKSYVYRYLDFSYQFEKSSRLNKVPIASINATRRVNSNFSMVTYPSGAFSKMPFEGAQTWFQQRQIELANRNAQNIQIDVPGQFNVQVGHVTDLYIYTEPPRNTDAGARDMYSLLDRTHSGRHLITAVRRSISRSEAHTMSLTLSKDSMIKGA